MTQVHSYYDKITADLKYYSNVIQKKFSLFCNILVSACYLVTFMLVTSTLLHPLLVTSLKQTVMQHCKMNTTIMANKQLLGGEHSKRVETEVDDVTT